MTEEQIHAAIISDPDVTPTNEAFWAKAHIVMPRRKQTVTMRLDADLLAWLRREPGYQTRINAILRAYMNAQGNRQPDVPTAKARRVLSNRR
ncbi:MAG TPA: BrnA antitoxin family protein [Candidatus Binataceae bacterium]